MDKEYSGNKAEPAHFSRNFGCRALRKLLFLPCILGINDRLESSRYADMNIIYCNSPVEYIQDIYIPAAKSFLTSHSCYKASRTVAGFLVTVTKT
jgi:hypothetical protein